MMKTLRSLILIGVMGLLALPAAAQTVLTTGTLSTAETGVPAAVDNTITVSSASGMTANTTSLYFPITGEMMAITGISGTTISVSRGQNGTVPYALASSALFYVVPTGATTDRDPGGACTRGQGYARFSPLINVANGNIWVCRSSVWQAANLRLITYNSTPPLTP